MSALGQKQTFELEPAMSALPPKADIGLSARHVRLVPCMAGSGLALIGLTRKLIA